MKKFEVGKSYGYKAIPDVEAFTIVEKIGNHLIATCGDSRVLFTEDGKHVTGLSKERIENWDLVHESSKVEFRLVVNSQAVREWRVYDGIQNFTPYTVGAFIRAKGVEEHFVCGHNNVKKRLDELSN